MWCASCLQYLRAPLIPVNLEHWKEGELLHSSPEDSCSSAFLHALFASGNGYRTVNQSWRNRQSWALCLVFSNGSPCLVYKKFEETWTWFIDINELAFSSETVAWETLFFLLDFSGDFDKWDRIIDFAGKRQLVNWKLLQSQCQWMSLPTLLCQKEWTWH